MDVCFLLVSPNESRSFRRKLLVWYRAHGRDLPWRRARDPYAVLISEIMLQQTQVATVIPRYHRWLRRFPSIGSLAAAAESDVLHAWQGLGYYARARNLHSAAKTLMRDHRGNFPHDAEAIHALPGVGRYTANAVATFAFNQSVPLVEANTARLLARLTNLQLPIDAAPGRSRLWEAAAAFLPKQNAAEHNSAMMDLGALVCTPQPKCQSCPVKRFCRATAPDRIPLKRRPTRTINTTEAHTFTFSRDRVLLEQSRTRWRGMWILPRLPRAGGEPALHTSHFPFTHHRVKLAVYRRRSARETSTRRWFSRESLHAIPIPSPHRRALAALLDQSAQKLW